MILSVNQVVKKYKERMALDFLSIEAKKGQVIGLLGPNGAGKTTIIKAIIGLIGIDDGEITVFDKKQDGKNKDIRSNIGYVTQEITIYEDMSARDNLRFFGSLYKINPAFIEQRILEVAELIGLKDRLDEVAANFSGGMKRRLNIGCSLLHNPKLLIMDEPTVGVDPQSRNYILDFVKKMSKQGVTVIYTSHYIEEVQAVGDFIYIMDAGHVIAKGSLQELIEKVKGDSHLQVSVKLSNDELKVQIENIRDVKEVYIEKNNYHIIYPNGSNVIEHVIQILKPLGILNVNSQQPNLEDVFLTITGKQLRDGENHV